MIHKFASKCVVFLLPRRLTRSAIYVKIADRVSSQGKRKTTQYFEANLCGSLYSTFKTFFNPYAIYNKRFKCFFDQLVRSKAICSFNVQFLGKWLSTETLINLKYFDHCTSLYFTSRTENGKCVFEISPTMNEQE